MRRLITDDFDAPTPADVLLAPANVADGRPSSARRRTTRWRCTSATRTRSPSNLSGDPAMSVPSAPAPTACPSACTGVGPGAGRTGDVPGRGRAGTGNGPHRRWRRATSRAADGCGGGDGGNWWSGSRSTSSWRRPPSCSRPARTASATIQHQHRPGHPRPARCAARCSTITPSSSRCGSVSLSTAPSSPLLRPQELLLPRHAQGVPDQPVRPALNIDGCPRRPISSEEEEAQVLVAARGTCTGSGSGHRQPQADRRGRPPRRRRRCRPS